MAKHTAKNNALDMFSAIKVPERKEKANTDQDSAKPEPVVEETDPGVGDTESETPNVRVLSGITSAKSNGIQLRVDSVKKKVRTNHTRSFYMSDEVYNSLIGGAEENGIKVSEYLDFLLKQVFSLSE